MFLFCHDKIFWLFQNNFFLQKISKCSDFVSKQNERKIWHPNTWNNRLSVLCHLYFQCHWGNFLCYRIFLEEQHRPKAGPGTTDAKNGAGGSPNKGVVHKGHIEPCLFPSLLPQLVAARTLALALHYFWQVSLILASLPTCQWQTTKGWKFPSIVKGDRGGSSGATVHLPLSPGLYKV